LLPLFSKEQVNKANDSYLIYLHAHVQHETTAVLYKNIQQAI